MTKHITINELYTFYKTKEIKCLILDVRTREEFASSRVPGSKNIPYDEVAQRKNELDGFEKIYIYCQAGKRSQIATGILEKVGLTNLICVSGTGMADWLTAGYPTEK